MYCHEIEYIFLYNKGLSSPMSVDCFINVSLMSGSASRCLTSSSTVPGAVGDQTDGQRDLDLDFIYFTTNIFFSMPTLDNPDVLVEVRRSLASTPQLFKLFFLQIMK